MRFTFFPFVSSSDILFPLSSYQLSKSSYIRGLQCTKALFLFRHYPHLRDPIPPSRKATFNRGQDVGVLARQLFPGGVDAMAKPATRSTDAVERTKVLMAEGVEVIYEAGFIYDDVLVLVDILVRDGAGWKAYEVKSSLRLSPAYFNDAALQYYVLKGAGVALTDFYLTHIHGDYVRVGALNIQQLFKHVSIVKTATEQTELIAKRIADLKHVLVATQTPDVRIGEHCFYPYECDFKSQCWSRLPEGNIFLLTGVPRREQMRLFEQGVKTVDRVADSEDVNELAKLQIKTWREGNKHIVREELKNWLLDFQTDVLFLDIENFMPAVPRFENTRPFHALPFAYSLHERKANEKNTTHKFFMAEPGADPRVAFINQLLLDTAGEKPVLVYDASAEKNTLSLLKKAFPDRAAELEQLNKRIHDLMLPFSKGWYHDAAMNGSISLKSVLPALVPELSYTNMRIGSGSHAMAVYEKLDQETDLFSQAEQRDALEEYCRLDTFGMVKILEVLEASAL